MTHFAFSGKTYQEADAFLAGRSQRKIGHNTYLCKHISLVMTEIVVVYHSTKVIGWSLDDLDTVVISNGGWDTVTTAKRINTFTLPHNHVRIRGRRMRWVHGNGNDDTFTPSVRHIRESNLENEYTNQTQNVGYGG